MIPVLGKLFDKFVYLRTNSPSQKVSGKIKSKTFENSGILFNGVSVHGNGRDGIHINPGRGVIETKDLMTSQRQEVESLREEWSAQHNLTRPVSVYTQPWDTGEMEWVNQQLRSRDRSWRVEVSE